MEHRENDSESSQWSVRANFWRGDRALGGTMVVHGDRLAFTPHAFDRATGGSTTFTVPLSEIRSLATVPRSVTFPRRRLLIETCDGRTGVFLIPRQEEIAERLAQAVAAAGGPIVEPDQVKDLPAVAPDDSLVMRVMLSGWLHLITVPLWTALLVSLVLGSSGPFAIALASLVLLSSIFWTIRGFLRSSRIRRARAPHERPRSGR
ncbi:hypothetical protein [Aeromicrobium alkaliterrae]|uniref:GRAM domain-containing protein n=1 Tax=Aeromicrobium alkaliterrae TaxID=302168 RepID=A0ABN2JJQ7_9ACTN